MKPVARSMIAAAAGAAIALAATLTSGLAQSNGDGKWITYSGSLSAQRFSPLDQITPSNVARLRPAWVYQPPGAGSLETTPLAADGVLYATWGPTAVAALDVTTGKPLWEWTRPIAASVLNLGFPRVNRGVALLGDMVYVGTLDGY